MMRDPRVMLPAHAQRQTVPGAFATGVRARVALAPPGMNKPAVMAKPAIAYRGALMRAYNAPQHPLSPPSVPFAALANKRRLFIHGPPPGATRGGMRGLGEGDGDMTVDYNVTSNEPVVLPASPATPDSSFDWSKVISSALTAGGAITSNVLTGRYAVAAANASRPNVVMAPAAASAAPLMSNKTLIIGGVAVVGILALALMLRK